MSDFTSYKGRILDFGIKKGTFKGDDGEPVSYKQTVIRVELDGDVEEIAISGQKAPTPTLLESVLKGAKNFGDDPKLFGPEDIK